MADSTVSAYLIARAQSETAAATQGAEVRAAANQRGDALYAEALPAYAETVRMGNTWTCVMAQASAFVLLAEWPTVRSELILYNGEAANGKSYLVESAFAYCVVTMAVSQPVTVIGQLIPTLAAALTNDTAQLITSNSGKIAYTGKAQRDLVDDTGGAIANKWDVLATSIVPAPTTNLGTAVVADLRGFYIIPPGGALGLNIVAGTTAAFTGILGVTWTEIQLTLG